MRSRRLLSYLSAGVVLTLGLAGCEESQGAPAAAPAPAAAKRAVPTDAVDPLEAASQRLHAIARSGLGDAAAEARRAMDRGDFRFVGYLFLVPGGWSAAYGVACDPGVASRPSLVGPVLAGSDVPTDIEEERTREANFRRFGAVYNATLLADPRFPHRDMCRAVPVGDERERTLPDQ